MPNTLEDAMATDISSDTPIIFLGGPLNREDLKMKWNTFFVALAMFAVLCYGIARADGWRWVNVGNTRDACGANQTAALIAGLGSGTIVIECRDGSLWMSRNG